MSDYQRPVRATTAGEPVVKQLMAALPVGSEIRLMDGTTLRAVHPAHYAVVNDDGTCNPGQGLTVKEWFMEWEGQMFEMRVTHVGDVDFGLTFGGGTRV